MKDHLGRPVDRFTVAAAVVGVVLLLGFGCGVMNGTRQRTESSGMAHQAPASAPEGVAASMSPSIDAPAAGGPGALAEPVAPGGAAPQAQTAPAEASELRHAEFNPEQTYYVNIPRSCQGERACPVVVVVHGAMASGRGDFNLWKPYSTDEGFVLIAPNFSLPADFSGQPGEFPNKEDQAIFRIINELSKPYKLDRQKVMLLGVTTGAKFVNAFVMTHRAFAHSAVLLNVGNLPPPEPAVVPGRPRYYLAVGALETEYAQQAPQFVDALRAAGYQAEVLVAPGIGHSVPPRAITDILQKIRSMKAGV